MEQSALEFEVVPANTQTWPCPARTAESPVTLRGVTWPWLSKFTERFGPLTPLCVVLPKAIAALLGGQGGRKKTRKHRLSPISGDKPCHGIAFWREPTERPHESTQTFHTTEELGTLLRGGGLGSVPADGIALCLYLGFRLADAAERRRGDFKWDALLVQVRHRRTRHSGVEVSPVQRHRALVEPFGDPRGGSG